MQWFIRDGMSLNGIAHRLNEMGVPNPTAYKHSKGWQYCNPHAKQNDGMWAGSTVRRMLESPVNIGHMVQGKQRVVSYKVHDKVAVSEDEWYVAENTHEPTFTPEEYSTLLRLLERDTRTPNGGRTVHMFSGFMRCSDCGKALQRKASRDNVYYVCRTYAEKSKVRCTRHSIRIDILESAVLAAIQNQIAFVDSLVEMANEINRAPEVNTQSQRLEKLLKDKQRALNKTQSIADGLYADLKTGLINITDYKRLKAKYDEQIAGLNEVIENLVAEQQKMGQGVNCENEVFTAFRKIRNVQRLDRALLIELVDKIHVREDKEIVIAFRFESELNRVKEFVEMNTGSAREG